MKLFPFPAMCGFYIENGDIVVSLQYDLLVSTYFEKKNDLYIMWYSYNGCNLFFCIILKKLVLAAVKLIALLFHDLIINLSLVVSLWCFHLD